MEYSINITVEVRLDVLVDDDATDAEHDAEEIAMEHLDKVLSMPTGTISIKVGDMTCTDTEQLN
jgi:hypothetical protein